MRKVLQQLRQYKKDSFLCIGLTALEVDYGNIDALCHCHYHRQRT